MSTDDPVTQAEDAVVEGVLLYGREVVRKHFIEPAFDNGGEVTLEIVVEVARMRDMGGDGILGMTCAIIEEAAGILKARRMESARCRQLERKLEAAERNAAAADLQLRKTDASLRSIMDKYVNNP